MSANNYLDKKRDEIVFLMFGDLAPLILEATDADECADKIRGVLQEVWDEAGGEER